MHLVTFHCVTAKALVEVLIHSAESLQYMSHVGVRLACFMESALVFMLKQCVFLPLCAGVNSCRSWSQPQSELHHQLDVIKDFSRWFYLLLAIKVTSWHTVQSVSIRTVMFLSVLALYSRTLEVEGNNN